ncbi:MAG: hypothetical protein HC836_45610 [Richelia sp. RM2_1_2]|nr:hypothetical protein [Richelia sp. RM2_1_2]
MTNLETQALLLISELEIAVVNGLQLPTDVIIAMNNFRSLELLITGKHDYKVRNMILELRKQYGNINNN